MAGTDGLEMSCIRFDLKLRNNMRNLEDKVGERAEERRGKKGKKKRKI
jgi:hypothetical protein